MGTKVPGYKRSQELSFSGNVPGERKFSIVTFRSWESGVVVRCGPMLSDVVISHTGKEHQPNLTVNPTVQPDRLFVHLTDPYSKRVNALGMRYYVSWKTTGYYSKYSLKLAARCPVSGCWPSCFLLHSTLKTT